MRLSGSQHEGWVRALECVLLLSLASRLSVREAMDMAVTFVVATDIKPLARRMCETTLKDACIFSSMAEHAHGQGQCARHGGCCHLPAGSCDLMTAGLPCHPFSPMRFRGGVTSETGPDHLHREFQLVVQDFPALVQIRKPGAQAFDIMFALAVQTTDTVPFWKASEQFSLHTWL